MINKRAGLFLAVSLIIGSVVPVGAETLEERIAALEQAVAEQQKQIDDLQSYVGLGGAATEVESIAEAVEEAPVEEETIQKTTDEFLADIVESYNGRAVRTERYNTSEYNTMSSEEYVNTFLYCVEAEENFYEEYKNAVFDDLNIQYLCKTYCDGVKSQLDCCRKYLEDNDYATWSNSWTAAYNKRSYVIVELSEYYNAPFGDISSMAANVSALDSLNEAETRNAAVDRATVQTVQSLLNTIGFYCGNADGISGKRTVKSIKRFQEMYGYDPIDGMIDEELVSQLQEVANQKAETEGQAESSAESIAS